jgi:hypothetical protein
MMQFLEFKRGANKKFYEKEKKEKKEKKWEKERKKERDIWEKEKNMYV